MTSPTSAHIDRASRPRGAARRTNDRGFTLVELLVVIGIIVVLAGLLMPSLNKAWKSAARTAVGNDLQAIGAALEAYRQDFGDYPRVMKDFGLTGTPPANRPNPMTGAQMLCFALIGPAPAVDPVNPVPPGQRPDQDGQDGPGFRVHTGAAGALGGRVYPPYLSVDRFKFGDPSDPYNQVPMTAGSELLFCIVDRWNQPILYFPRSTSRLNVSIPPTAAAAGQVAPYVDSKIVNTTIPSSEVCRYDADDNLIWFTGAGSLPGPRDAAALTTQATTKLALKRIRAMLGDTMNATTDPTAIETSAQSTAKPPPPVPPTTPDGAIGRYETAVDLPYLLWSAGPDERFGPFSITLGDTISDADVLMFRDCDDVTNFVRTGR